MAKAGTRVAQARKKPTLKELATAARKTGKKMLPLFESGKISGPVNQIVLTRASTAIQRFKAFPTEKNLAELDAALTGLNVYNYYPPEIKFSDSSAGKYPQYALLDSIFRKIDPRTRNLRALREARNRLKNVDFMNLCISKENAVNLLENSLDPQLKSERDDFGRRTIGEVAGSAKIVKTEKGFEIVPVCFNRTAYLGIFMMELPDFIKTKSDLFFHTHPEGLRRGFGSIFSPGDMKASDAIGIPLLMAFEGGMKPLQSPVLQVYWKGKIYNVKIS